MFLLDCGSSISIIKLETLRDDAMLRVLDDPITIVGTGEGTTFAKYYVELTIAGYIKHVFFVVEDDFNIDQQGILGSDFCHEQKALINYDSHKLVVHRTFFDIHTELSSLGTVKVPVRIVQTQNFGFDSDSSCESESAHESDEPPNSASESDHSETKSLSDSLDDVSAISTDNSELTENTGSSEQKAKIPINNFCAMNPDTLPGAQSGTEMRVPKESEEDSPATESEDPGSESEENLPASSFLLPKVPIESDDSDDDYKSCLGDDDREVADNQLVNSNSAAYPAEKVTFLEKNLQNKVFDVGLPIKRVLAYRPPFRYHFW